MSDVTRSIRWRNSDLVGVVSAEAQCLEHCVLKIGAASIAAEGVMIGGDGDEPFGLRYRIVLDAEWAGLRSLHVTKLGGATVALRHDGYGEWTDGEGKKRVDLSKCLDMSLAHSHFAFTATVKRLSWKAGKTIELPVVHVDVPSLEVSRRLVKVTTVEPGKRYRVEPEKEDVREISVDEDGFVTRVGEVIERVS
jgi:hypothetical protein